MSNETVAERFEAYGRSFDPFGWEEEVEKCRRVGLTIDPATAEMEWLYVDHVDPYGILSPLVREFSCVGRDAFVCNPPDGDWVLFGDLPEATQTALCKRFDL